MYICVIFRHVNGSSVYMILASARTAEFVVPRKTKATTSNLAFGPELQKPESLLLPQSCVRKGRR